MLELALLGLLKERPMHGYDLRKRLREDFGALAHLSFGSLYPALARLENGGAITSIALDDRPEPIFPLTGSLGGERAATIARRATAKAAAALGGKTRARKVYEITDKGEMMFEQLLAVPDVADGDARSFSVRLAFARHLAPSARVRLLEQRRTELRESLSLTRRSFAAREGELDVYGRSIAEHATASLINEIDWIDSLLSVELAPPQSTTAKRSSSLQRADNNKGLRRPVGAKSL